MSQSKINDLLDKRGILGFDALDKGADTITFNFEGMEYAAPATMFLESEGVVLPNGKILHAEWACTGIEKLVHVGDVFPMINPIDAARKMHFGLAEITGFDPNYQPDLGELVGLGLIVLISN
ncbi:MAG: hypothetical protein HYV90_00005 [Candidatus Woesebacteria bacterium]|nr:MAG: hypothetical protein HYV90_00005 [Candidatus Woesebacteria bacterium]